MTWLPPESKLNQVVLEIAYNEGYFAGHMNEENIMVKRSKTSTGNGYEYNRNPNPRPATFGIFSLSDEEYAATVWSVHSDSSESDPQPRKRKHHTTGHSSVKSLIDTMNQQMKDFHAHSNVTAAQKEEIYTNLFKLLLEDQKAIDILPDKLGSFISNIVSEMKCNKNEKIVFLNKMSSLFANEIEKMEEERLKQTED